MVRFTLNDQVPVEALPSIGEDMPARVGDQVAMTSPCVGGCSACPHPWTGIIKSGSPNVSVNGIPVARQGDAGQCICPHGGTFKIIQGSPSAENSPPIARINDAVQCVKCGAVGKIVSGSPDVFVNMS